MKKNCYKILFDIFEIPKNLKAKHNIREKFKREIRKYYCNINFLNKKDLIGIDVDFLWNSLDDFDKSKLIREMKNYMFDSNYVRSNKREAIEKNINYIFDKNIIKLDKYNKDTNNMYKDYYSNCTSLEKKKLAYKIFIRDFNEIFPNLEKPSFNQWIDDNTCLKDLILLNKNYKKWKNDNKKFTIWIKEIGELKNEIEKYFDYNDSKKSDTFNDWFNSLEFQRMRIYDYVKTSESNYYIEKQENDNIDHFEVPQDKKNEVILKTIIKSLKEIGIEIYDDEIIEALDFVYNFNHDMYDTLNKDEYSLKYIEYNDKLKDYKFYSTKKYKEEKMRNKLK